MSREIARFHTVAHTLIRKPGQLDKRIYVFSFVRSYSPSQHGFVPRQGRA